MFSLSRPVWHTLRRTLEAAREELSLLEADLGLCQQCGERRLPPEPRRGVGLGAPSRSDQRRVA